MPDEPIQIQLRCSQCGRVVATIPKDYHLEEGLVCPGCGAAITPPGVIRKIAGGLKDVLADASGRRPDQSETGPDGDRDPDRGT